MKKARETKAPMNRTIASLLCPAVVVLACTNTGVQRTVRERTDLHVTAVALYPFGFRWDEPAFRSFEMSQRLMALAAEKTKDRVMWIGPSEFKVYKPDDVIGLTHTLGTTLPWPRG